MIAWLWAFLFTQAIEVPIYAIPLRGRPLVGFGASAITHPVVWFVFPLLIHDYAIMVVAAEVFAVVVEAAYLRANGVRRAFWWSLCANGASLGLGLVVRALTGAI
jgi:hypothetical protein